MVVLYIAIAVAIIVSDVLFFIIPIPNIVKLQMPFVQKIRAGIMFAIGSTVATSIIRMVYLLDLLGAKDTSWVAAQANVWSFVECNLFNICGSMPTFRKFLQRFAPTLIGMNHGHSALSKSAASTYGTLQSKLRRQTGMQYAQFYSLEIDDFGRAEERKHSPAHGTTVHVSSPPFEGGLRITSRDDASGETTLGHF